MGTPHYNGIRFVDLFPALDKSSMLEVDASIGGVHYDLSELMDNKSITKGQLESLYIVKIRPYKTDDDELGIQMEISDTIIIEEYPTWMH